MNNNLKMLFSAFIACSTLSLAAQVKSSGNNTQTAGTNNGVMNQYNITVKPETRKLLEDAAKKDFGIAQGWLPILTPASDLVGKTICPQIPQDLIKVILGGGNVGACDDGKCVILKDSDKDAETRNILSIERKGKSLQIQAVIFDEDGRVLAKLDGSKPHINTANAFEWNRPDPHTLDVIDQQNRTVLHIRFANPSTVYVEGSFHDARGNSARIKSDGMLLRRKSQLTGGINLGRNCSINARESAFAF